jgi:hypothetical protein
MKHKDSHGRRYLEAFNENIAFECRGNKTAAAASLAPGSQRGIAIDGSG